MDRRSCSWPVFTVRVQQHNEHSIIIITCRCSAFCKRPRTLKSGSANWTELPWHTNTYGRSVDAVFNAVICCDADDSVDRDEPYRRYGMHDHRAAISRLPVARPARHKSDRIPVLVRSVARDLSVGCCRRASAGSGRAPGEIARRNIQTFAE